MNKYKRILSSAHTVYLCVLYGSQEQTAIISLYSINWLVFITETECVYCAVQTESLYIIKGKLYFFIPLDAGLTSRMGQFDPRPVYVRVVVDKVVFGTVCLPILWLSPVSIIPPLPHTHPHLHTALTRRTNGDAWQLSKKEMFFRKLWNTG
jgi:hypothetical protein